MIQKLTGLLLLLTLPAVAKSQAQSYEWAFSYKGSISSSSTLTDQDGNIYVTGIFSNTFDGDPGPADLILDGEGSGKSFIQKLSPNGQLLWIKEYKGIGIVNISSAVIDTSGNLYVLGRFQGTIDFDPGPSENNITSTGMVGGFLAKFDSDGNLYWTK